MWVYLKKIVKKSIVPEYVWYFFFVQITRKELLMRKVITAALKPVWVQSRTKSFTVRMVSRVKCSTIRTMLSKLFFFKKDPECQAQVNSIFRKTLGRAKPTNKNNSVRLCSSHLFCFFNFRSFILFKYIKIWFLSSK